LPVAGSRTVHKAEGAGPTAIATRSLPVGASSLTAALSSAAAIAVMAMTIAPHSPNNRIGVSF
jgi:hypothetical protein